MKKIHIRVRNKIATCLKRDYSLVCGNGDYKIKFDFDDEWADYSEKIARFIWNGQHMDVPFTGDVCTVPTVYDTTACFVGVYVKDFETTTPARIEFVKSILCMPSVKNNESDKIYADEAMENAIKAANAANRAEQAAENAENNVRDALAEAKASGEFDGADGYTPQKGVDYFDGKDGQDGYTPIKGVDYFDGRDGTNGKDGVDGYTPVKGVDYFDGKNGTDGKDGTTFIPSVSDGVITWENDGGLPNPPPVNIKGEKGEKGDNYILTSADMDTIAALAAIKVKDGGVIGVVDSNNNIVMSGTLADGTYSVKFKMDDGSTVNIGNLVLDSNVYYSITNTLTNCSTNNSAKETIEGYSYTATITAGSGYELKSVTVTMGGVNITSSAVSGGKITIANVTGNIVITAVAEKVVKMVNQIPISTDASGNLYVGTNGEKGYKTGYRLSGSSGNESAQSGCCVSGFIPVEPQQKIRIKNIGLNSTEGYNLIIIYNSSKQRILQQAITNSTVIYNENGVYYTTPDHWTNGSTAKYFRFCCATIDANTIATVDQEIV